MDDTILVCDAGGGTTVNRPWQSIFWSCSNFQNRMWTFSSSFPHEGSQPDSSSSEMSKVLVYSKTLGFPLELSAIELIYSRTTYWLGFHWQKHSSFDLWKIGASSRASPSFSEWNGMENDMRSFSAAEMRFWDRGHRNTLVKDWRSLIGIWPRPSRSGHIRWADANCVVKSFPKNTAWING